MSDDGAWATYGYQQRRVDDTLFVKNLATSAEQKIPRASRSQFSDDSKWVAYFVAEPQAGAKGATARRRRTPRAVAARRSATGRRDSSCAISPTARP